MSSGTKASVRIADSKPGSSPSHAGETNASSPSSPIDRIYSLQRTVGNREVQRLLKSGVIQAKLKVNEPGDIHEQEADRIADQVMASPAHPALKGAPPRIQRFSRQSNGLDTAPSSVDQTLASPGRQLEPALQQNMEQRFGHDFSRVRVHSGTAAEQSAEDVNASAYTVGHNIVFGADRFAPATHEGRRLIVHELTHVVQQARGASAAASVGAHASARPVLVQRQPTTTTPPAAPTSGSTTGAQRKWKEAWSDFEPSKSSNRTKTGSFAKELLDIAERADDDIDVLDGGSALVVWFEDQGDTASADRMTKALLARFRRTAADKAQSLPTGGLHQIGSSVMGDPGALIKLGQRAARVGRDDRAFGYFLAAHEILLLYILRGTSDTQRTLDMSKQSHRYTQFKGFYNEMRAIYGFYDVVEDEARAANDTARAQAARTQRERLRDALRKQAQPQAEQDVELAEMSLIKGAKAPALHYLGGNYESTELTELPGHPFPSAVTKQKESVDTGKLAEVQNVLTAQADLQTELRREPAVRNAFGDEDIDLTQATNRHKVWGIMYGVYRRRGGDALDALMSLIGRYLKVYTYHTSFNVRDFGENYLDSPMPTELTGRLVQDCGVYALNVAWDVMQTAKKGDPSLKLTFTLATLLDHVILVIADKTSGATYFVNNELITRRVPTTGYAPQFQRPEGLPRSADVFLEDPPAVPPKPVDVDEEIGAQYMLLRNLPYLITPANYLQIGTTADKPADFKKAAWKHYRAATVYMSKVPVDYTMIEMFSVQSRVLDTKVDELLPKANDAKAISAWLTQGWPQIVSMLLRFDQLGLSAFKAAGPAPAGSRNAGAFRTPGGAHPLVRVALVLVRLQRLGQTLTTEQQRYLGNVTKAFPQTMSEHHAAAEAGRF